MGEAHGSVPTASSLSLLVWLELEFGREVLELGLKDTIFPELCENSISIPSASRRVGVPAFGDSVSRVGNVKARRITGGEVIAVALGGPTVPAMVKAALMLICL